MQLLPLGRQQFFDNTGTALAGGKVCFYLPGTTTPAKTYADQAGNIANSNPVVLDDAGEAVIWGEGAYHQVLCDSSDNLVWEADIAASISEIDLAASNGSSLVGFLQAGAGTEARTLQDKAYESLSMLDFLPVPAPADTADLTTFMNAAFATAKLAKKKLYFPGSRSYYHAAKVTNDSVIAYGDGPSTNIVSNPAAGSAKPETALVGTGIGPAFADMMVSTTWMGARTSNTLSSAVYFTAATGARIENVWIYGSPSVGVFADTVDRLLHINVHVENTLADGTHISNGCLRVKSRGYTTNNTGDDCFAVVSGGGDGSDRATDIDIDDFTVLSGAARGIAIVGAASVRIGKGYIYGCQSAGLYIASESEYGTYGVDEVTWGSIHIELCGTAGGVAALHISGQTGYLVNTIRGGKAVIADSRGVAVQVGATVTQALVTDVSLGHITATDVPDVPVLINGAKDVEIDTLIARGCASYGVYAQGAGNQGFFKLHSALLSNMNTSNSASINGVHFASTCAFASIEIDKIRSERGTYALARMILNGMTTGDFFVGTVSGDVTSVSSAILPRRLNTLREATLSGAPNSLPTGATVNQGDRFWYSQSAPGSAPGFIVTTGGVVGSTAVVKFMASLTA